MTHLNTKELLMEELTKRRKRGVKTIFWWDSRYSMKENARIYAFLNNRNDYMDDFEKQSILNNGCYDLFIDSNLLILKRVAGFGVEMDPFFEVYKRI